MKYVRKCLSAVLAGIAVACSGAVYLSTMPKSALFASLVFSVGFLTVLIFELHLFTDKIGYVLTGGGRLKKKVASILFVLLGNLVGVCLSGMFLHGLVGEQAAAALAVKATIPAFDVFVRAVFCGILMFVSAHGYRRREGGFTGFVLSVMALATVALCGFEHVFIDLFYASAAFCLNNRVLTLVVLSFIGNTLGALIFSYLYSIKKDDKKDAGKEKHHHHTSAPAEDVPAKEKAEA